ncbi:MAG: hypothetical protein C6I01_00355, partial [Epsilonproteobacteria bacterium]|nr:hypothetical protein [Campylobacterota bacterium]NPA88958.1 UvrD-helicase domain-containing protein [Campylobacterota bacterium]
QEQKYLIHYLQSNPTKGVKEFFQWLNILYGRYFEVYPILRKYTRQIEKKEVHRQVGVLKKEIEKILAQLEEMSGRGSLMTIVEKIVTGEEEGKLQKYFKRMGVLDSPQFRQLVFQYYRKQLEYEKLQEIMELGSLGRILESYQSLRIGEQKRVGEFGFTDIGVIAHQLLRGENSIDKEFFYFRLDSKFTHILIDEFQDTSLLQWEILEPLVDEIKAGEGTHPTSRSFFYVGDTNQAIYRWRGGEEKLFEAVCHRLRPYGLKKESLEKNYRSGKVLVNYFKEIFKVKQEGVKEGGYLEVKEFPDPEEIKGEVLEQIKNLLAKGVAPSQIAVLSRGNREVEEFYQLLKGEGIPVVTSTTKGRVVAHPKVEGILGAIRHLYLKEMGVEDSLNLAKFEGILGRKVEEGELPPLDLNSPPAPYIRHLLQKFELLDPITLQFWEISLNYPTFAHLYWNIEKDHTKLSEGELEGVNLMTIHASKGLEFDYLFLPDFLYSPPNSSTPLFFYGTGECSCERGGDCNLSLLEIRKRFSKNKSLTAKFDTHWQKIREEEERAKYREEWNSIYVAFTRAKRGLFVYYLHPKVRKGRAKSYFLTYLPQLKPEKRGKLEIAPPQEENISNIQWLNWEEYPHWGAQEHREKGEEEFIGDIGAIFKGRALHYSFEMGDIEAGRNWFGSYLNFDQLEELFARRWRELTSRLPGVWFRELPFLWEGREKRGDLIVVRPDGSLVIVDYKTSFQKSSLSKYRRQVREYLRGLEEITGTSKIEGWLFFTDTGEWVRV